MPPNEEGLPAHGRPDAGRGVDPGRLHPPDVPRPGNSPDGRGTVERVDGKTKSNVPRFTVFLDFEELRLILGALAAGSRGRCWPTTRPRPRRDDLPNEHPEGVHFLALLFDQEVEVKDSTEKAPNYPTDMKGGRR